jgi:hypothetical protein
MIVSVIFTDFCLDKEVKYEYGWIYNGIIAFTFVVLAPGIILNIIGRIWLIFK